MNYIDQHEMMRIISARKANQREITHYENKLNEDNP